MNREKEIEISKELLSDLLEMHLPWLSTEKKEKFIYERWWCMSFIAYLKINNSPSFEKTYQKNNKEYWLSEFKKLYCAEALVSPSII